jgi:transcriptional regulator with XRE-family HTH domain
VNFGQRLRAAREAAGLSRRVLANLTGISSATIMKAESGTDCPRLPTVLRLLQACGVTPVGHGPPPPVDDPEHLLELRAVNRHPDAGLPGWGVVGVVWWRRRGKVIARVSHTGVPDEPAVWMWWLSHDDDRASWESGHAETPREAMRQADRALEG